MRARLRVGLLLGLLAWLLTACGNDHTNNSDTAAHPLTQTSQPSQLHIIDNERIDEASGLAASHTNPGTLWIHNDSGSPAVVYAIDQQVHYRGQIRIQGIDANDWEDMASFQIQQQAYLLLADIGDNHSRREHVTLNIITDPDISQRQDGFAQDVPIAWRINVTYPDGARDAEGVAVDTQNQHIYLLSKRDYPPRLYRIPLRPPSHSVVAEFITALPATARHMAARPTALDIRADNQCMLIVTYQNAYEFCRQHRQPWPEALTQTPRILPTLIMPQQEAGGYSHDDQSIWLASEQLPAMLVNIPAP